MASRPDTGTSFRFTDEDRRVLEKLRKLTGLSATAAIRLAIREAVAARVGKPRK